MGTALCSLLQDVQVVGDGFFRIELVLQEETEAWRQGSEGRQVPSLGTSFGQLETGA